MCAACFTIGGWQCQSGGYLNAPGLPDGYVPTVATLEATTQAAIIIMQDPLNCSWWVDQANATAAGINTEERLLGWAATKFPQLATFSERLAPLVELWALAVGFFDTQLAWLNAPLPSLNSIIIGQEVTSCLDGLSGLEKVSSWDSARPSLASQLSSID